jgi:hypothetical protein
MEKKTLIIIGSIVGGVAVLGLCCCGVGGFFAYTKIRDAGDRVTRLNDLREIAMAMHSFHDANKGRMPATADDLRPFLSKPTVAERIKSGEIAVVWNAASLNEQPNWSNMIYCWETKPANNGNRLVAYVDGMGAQLTEAEFQSTPKAKTK